jgi:hypothetical protein
MLPEVDYERVTVFCIREFGLLVDGAGGYPAGPVQNCRYASKQQKVLVFLQQCKFR